VSEQKHVQIPTRLAPIDDKLRKLGYVVVPHGGDVCVRLPLLCSVRMREEQGHIRFIPKFGPFGRSTGLALTTGVAIAAVAATAVTGGLVPVAVASFAGVAALTIEACRFVVTEGCLTRLQNLLDRDDESSGV
jgi:hypothetical protein